MVVWRNVAAGISKIPTYLNAKNSVKCITGVIQPHDII